MPVPLALIAALGMALFAQPVAAHESTVPQVEAIGTVVRAYAIHVTEGKIRAYGP